MTDTKYQSLNEALGVSALYAGGGLDTSATADTPNMSGNTGVAEGSTTVPEPSTGDETNHPDWDFRTASDPAFHTHMYGTATGDSKFNNGATIPHPPGTQDKIPATSYQPFPEKNPYRGGPIYNPNNIPHKDI